MKILREENKTINITSDNLSDYVGNPVFSDEKTFADPQPGVVMGLAWTGMGKQSIIQSTILKYLGGASLYVEALADRVSGEASLKQTGQLGDVMKESIKYDSAIG